MAAVSGFFRARGFLAAAAPIVWIWIRDSSERCPRVFLKPRLGLKVKTLQLLAAQVLDNLGGDRSLQRSEVGDDLLATRHQHLGGERLALLDGLTVDEELLPLLDAVLLAAHLDHCIHAHRLHTKMPADRRAD